MPSNSHRENSSKKQVVGYPLTLYRLYLSSFSPALRFNVAANARFSIPRVFKHCHDLFIVERRVSSFHVHAQCRVFASVAESYWIFVSSHDQSVVDRNECREGNRFRWIQLPGNYDLDSSRFVDILYGPFNCKRGRSGHGKRNPLKGRNLKAKSQEPGDKWQVASGAYLPLFERTLASKCHSMQYFKCKRGEITSSLFWIKIYIKEFKRPIFRFLL